MGGQLDKEDPLQTLKHISTAISHAVYLVQVLQPAKVCSRSFQGALKSKALQKMFKLI